MLLMVILPVPTSLFAGKVNEGAGYVRYMEADRY